jgi:hypothetical protein
MIQYKERKYLNDQLKRGWDEKNNKVRSQLTNERRERAVAYRSKQRKTSVPTKPNGQPTHTHTRTERRKKKRLAAANTHTQTDDRTATVQSPSIRIAVRLLNSRAPVRVNT